MRLTLESFDALATLGRLRAGITEQAALQVLVHGKRPRDVARELGTSEANVNNAASNVRRLAKLAQTACAGLAA